ncbi:hypothetical protein HPB52_024733 [Rhipicephalus sanguineus]|uniref:Uncharacterized protein n=1 Tax=Rhipicephalus sanguineus TaxID=34632 RepID=A0A9D4TDZ1_RHISA|nr:hypothetical protein HPB52_024733 [Rhipicephalus sanguineus]
MRQQLKGREAVAATLRDKRLGDKPQVEVWFLGKGDGEILATHGLKRRGVVPHRSALFYVKYGLRAREERSCTDGSKSWFPPAMKKLEVRPVAEMGLSSSAMKKWRIDTATSQLVHRSLHRDQFLGVLITAEYQPAVASTYVSSLNDAAPHSLQKSTRNTHLASSMFWALGIKKQPLDEQLHRALDAVSK